MAVTVRYGSLIKVGSWYEPGCQLGGIMFLIF